MNSFFVLQIDTSSRAILALVVVALRPRRLDRVRRLGVSPRFTLEEDARPVKLKEKNAGCGKNWACVPGRSMGSLQVCYCTKPKDRTTSARKDS
jgi:hypothetical protein